MTLKLGQLNSRLAVEEQQIYLKCSIELLQINLTLKKIKTCQCFPITTYLCAYFLQSSKTEFNDQVP